MRQSLWSRSLRERGFTLVELVAVMSLVSILSITALPVVGTIERARQNAAVVEVARRCVFARRRAAETGEPTALSIDPAQDELLMIRLAQGQTVSQPAPSFTGGVASPWAVPVAFPGVHLISFGNGDGRNGNGDLWFLADGSPQVRQADGTFAPFTQDATITLSGGLVVTIRRVTGAVEP